MNRIAKESWLIVLTGTAINYPASLLSLWFLMSVMDMDSPFWIGTWTTVFLTLLAYARVYYIRSRYERAR